MFMVRSYLGAIRISWRSASAIRPNDARLKTIKFSAISDGDNPFRASAHITGPSSQHYIDKFEILALDVLVSRIRVLYQAMKLPWSWIANR